MALFYLHNFWASGVWSMLLAMLYVESLTYIEKISWQEINSGNALINYVFLVDKVKCLSQQWDLKTTASVVFQMIGLVVTVLAALDLSNTPQVPDSLKQGYFVAAANLAVMPALNLLGDLLAAGIVTDTINSKWLARLKDLELEHISSQRGHGDFSTIKPSERAYRIFSPASATTTTARELPDHFQPLNNVPSIENLEALETKIRTFQHQLVISVAKFFTVTTQSVVSVFAKLFGCLIIMYGLFYEKKIFSDAGITL